MWRAISKTYPLVLTWVLTSCMGEFGSKDSEVTASSKPGTNPQTNGTNSTTPSPMPAQPQPQPDPTTPAPPTPTPPTAPVGCAGATSCFGFEDNALPNGWSYGGDNPAPMMDATRAHSGTKALHFTFNGGDGYKPHIKANVPGDITNVLHVRYYVYMTGPSVYYGTMVAASGTQTNNSYGRYTQNIDGDHFLTAFADNDLCRWNMQDTFRAVCDSQNANCTNADVTASKLPIGKWVCIETMFDGSSGAPASMRIDGTPIKLFSSAPGWPKMTKFTSLEIGYQECHIFNDKQVWLDDIAISKNPIGCN